MVEERYIFLGKGGETSENFILRLTGRNEDTPFFCALSRKKSRSWPRAEESHAFLSGGQCCFVVVSVMWGAGNRFLIWSRATWHHAVRVERTLIFNSKTPLGDRNHEDCFWPHPKVIYAVGCMGNRVLAGHGRINTPHHRPSILPRSPILTRSLGLTR